MPLASRRFLACFLTLLWFAGWVASGWLDVEVKNGSFSTALGLSVYCVVGFFLLVWLVQLFWVRERWLISAATLLTLLPLILAVGGDSRGTMVLTRYRWEARRLKPMIARLETMPPATRQAAADTACRVETGNPLRVACRTGSSFIWNGEAVVYDPTGQIVRLSDVNSGKDPYTTLPPRNTVFGSLPLSAEPLGNSWYFCHFYEND